MQMILIVMTRMIMTKRAIIEILIMMVNLVITIMISIMMTMLTEVKWVLILTNRLFISFRN